MALLECRAMGTVAEEHVEELMELLVGLSGTQPAALEQYEVVLRPPAAAASVSGTPAAWKPDLRLQHDLNDLSTSGRTEELSDIWTVQQFSLHLRGKQHAELPATVRHVTRTCCAGDNVPAFWQALGFQPRYQFLRRGHHFLIPLEGQEVEVSLCRLLRLPPLVELGADGTSASSTTLDAVVLQAATEVSPGRLLVEAVACVPSEGDHLETVGAVTSLAALLQPFTTLQRPPRAPGEPV